MTAPKPTPKALVRGSHVPDTAANKRMDKIEEEAAAHRRDDLNQFGQLREDIASLGRDLGGRITALAHDLQGQIDKFTLDKARAEGEASGLAKAAEAQAKVVEAQEKSSRPNPWLLAIAPVIAGVLFGAILSWAARDHLQGGLGSGDHATTTISTTIPAKP